MGIFRKRIPRPPVDEDDVIMVTRADAVAELCSAADPDLEYLHEVLIDLLQAGDLRAGRDAAGTLRFSATAAGALKMRARLQA